MLPYSNACGFYGWSKHLPLRSLCRFYGGSKHLPLRSLCRLYGGRPMVAPTVWVDRSFSLTRRPFRKKSNKNNAITEPCLHEGGFGVVFVGRRHVAEASGIDTYQFNKVLGVPRTLFQKGSWQVQGSALLYYACWRVAGQRPTKKLLGTLLCHDFKAYFFG